MHCSGPALGSAAVRVVLGCGRDGAGPSEPGYGEAKLVVTIPKLMQTTIARVGAEVSAADMDTIREDLAIGEDAVAPFPRGEFRLVYSEAVKDSTRRGHHAGERTMDEAVAQRFEQLERRVQRQRRALVLLTAALGAAVTIAATGNGQVYDLLRTRELQVVDAAGVIVCKAAAAPGGGALTVSNSAGQLVLSATALPQGAGLAIGNNAGQVVFTASARDEGGLLGINNRDGRIVFGASVVERGDGGVMAFYDKVGQRVLSAGVGSIGNGYLSLFNGAGTEVVQAYVDDNGQGYVGVWDRDRKGRTLTPR